MINCYGCRLLYYSDGKPVCKACSATGRVLGQFMNDGKPRWCSIRPENIAKCKNPKGFRRHTYRHLVGDET